MTTYVIGSRSSPLAMAQSKRVIDQLSLQGMNCEILPVTTYADRFLSKPLTEIGGKSLFSRELDKALINKKVDMCVHSLKDLESKLDPDISIVATLEREDPRDMFVLNPQSYIHSSPSSVTDKSLIWSFIPKNAQIGTCAPRRKSFLLHFRPDLKISPIRGNIERRIKIMQEQSLDAIVLAKVSFLRLNIRLDNCITIPEEEITPSASQGVISVVMQNKTDERLQILKEALIKINHKPTFNSSVAERSFLSSLNCSCHSPVASFATYNENALKLKGVILSLNGKQLYSQELEKPFPFCPERQGRELAVSLASKVPESLLNQLNIKLT